MRIRNQADVTGARVSDDISGAVCGVCKPGRLEVCESNIGRGRRWRVQDCIEKGSNQNRAQWRELASSHDIPQRLLFVLGQLMASQMRKSIRTLLRCATLKSVQLSHWAFFSLRCLRV
jgi:hypothetical protein